MDIAVSLTLYLPITEAENIANYGKLALEIKNMWQLNMSVYP